jgi:hypothetical protein
LASLGLTETERIEIEADLGYRNAAGTFTEYLAGRLK